MERFYISLVSCAVFLLVLTHGSKAGERKLYGVVNPGCNEALNNSLVYVRADGSTDTIHYLWSTFGSFSVLMAQTSLDTNMTINWEKFLTDDPSESISFTEPPMYSSVMVLTRLYEYDDIHDKNNITKISDDDITTHNFIDLNWAPAVASNDSDKQFTTTFTTVSGSNDSEVGDGTIQLNVKTYGYEAHASKLPHLLHTANSFQLELILNKFNTVYNHTRFVLEVIAFANETIGEYGIHMHRSIDDEYTPSVFTTYQMTSPNSQDGGWGSFLQWKPICYTTSDRSTQDSTATHQELGPPSLFSNRTDELDASLWAAYNGSGELSLNASLNVSYGLQEDDFYQKKNYLTWTATFGLGVPPSEKFSTLVIAVIIVGFGVPAILIIIGGIIILVRRFKSRDDELNLSSAKLFDEDEQQ